MKNKNTCSKKGENKDRLNKKESREITGGKVMNETAGRSSFHVINITQNTQRFVGSGTHPRTFRLSDRSAELPSTVEGRQFELQNSDWFLERSSVVNNA
jgi:hypothetical protein